MSLADDFNAKIDAAIVGRKALSLRECVIIAFNIDPDVMMASGENKTLDFIFSDHSEVNIQGDDYGE